MWKRSTYSTRASLAGVPLTCRHLVLSLLGLIARPVVAGVEDVDEEADEVLEEVDEVEEVEEAEEEADEVVVPALSCLIKSAARSAWSLAFVTEETEEQGEHTNP
jgi:hypothetical protein